VSCRRVIAALCGTVWRYYHRDGADSRDDRAAGRPLVIAEHSPVQGASLCRVLLLPPERRGRYRFSSVRIRGARCASIKKVVTGYFKGRGRPAGSVPTDGYLVYGWNVLLHTSTLDGRKPGARFSGTYTFTPAP